MTVTQHDKKNTWRRLAPWLAGLILIAGILWHYTRPDPPHVQLVSVGRGLVEATVSNTRAGTVKSCHRA